MATPDSTSDAPARDTVALIVAAGTGSRARGDDAAAPAKQYALLGDRPMLARALGAFLDHPRVSAVMAVIAAGDEARYRSVVRKLGPAAERKLLAPVHGGETRQASVANGLAALSARAPEIVLIHDAARPFVSPALISAVIDALESVDGAIPLVPLTDTVKRIAGGRVVATEDRESLAGAQTPQGFGYGAIRAAHDRAAIERPARFTDDAAIAEWAGMSVAAVAGDPANVKITTPADLAAAQARFEDEPGGHHAVRIGQGFDVHAFAPGTAVRLCGVDVPHTHALKGHSDADVALHALTDALYGALGDGDIGSHFPPSDPQWAGADSSLFLAHARDAVAARGGRIEHVDVTIVCERPKIGPHRAAMTARLRELLRLEADQVSVKATTTERLGFTGRGEGIAALALATVALPTARQE